MTALIPTTQFSPLQPLSPAGGPMMGSRGRDERNARDPFAPGLFDSALELGGVGLWRWDIDSGGFLLSRMARTLLGLPSEFDNGGRDDAEPVDYERVKRCIVPEDRAGVEQALIAAFNSRTPFEHEFRVHVPPAATCPFPCGSGGLPSDLAYAVFNRPRWILARGGLLTHPRETGETGSRTMTGSLTDITARRSTESDLRDCREEAERTLRVRVEFLANMSHEFRSMIASIVGFTEILRAAQSSDELRAQCLETVQRNAQQLFAQVNDILDLARVEAGQLEVEKSLVSLSDLLLELRNYFGLKAQRKDLSFDIVTADETPLAIFTDSVRLRQILFNLIDNAIKFTDHGGVKVDVRFEASESALAPSSLLIFVSDTGMGIADPVRKRLFLPFEQADPSCVRRYGGTGLGLALSSRLALLLGGELILWESILGKGTTFLLNLNLESCNFMGASREAGRDFLGQPLGAGAHRSAHEEGFRTASAAAAHATWMGRARDEGRGPETPEGGGDGGSPAAAGAESAGCLQGVRVLVAEDAGDSRTIIRNYLQNTGAEVLFASNGRQAVEKALHVGVDVILMDVMMPELDGLEATARLRQHGFDKAIIAMTAPNTQDARIRTLTAGCDDLLLKPIPREMLIRKLAEHLPVGHCSACGPSLQTR